VTFDPSDDFVDVADGLESITLNRRGSDAESITNALRREVTTREAAASNGKLTTADTRWHFPVSAVDSIPALGDVVEDASGNQFTVMDVQEATLGKRYKCATRNVAVVYGLDSVVTIEKATYSKGTQGAMERTWTTWKKVKARIQPSTAQAETSAGMKRTEKRYQVLLATTCDVDNSHRIKAADGTLYKFAGATQADQIGQPQIIEVTKWQT